MVENEDTGKKGGETCDAIEGGYSIFLDGETIQSFMESGDLSSARELDHFKEVESQVEKWLKEGEGVSLLALSANDNRLSRDFSVLQIAHLMAKHGKTVLIVDCDFLHPGLSGLIEKTEDYGFLDLLLYGSSLQSISRSTGIDGVNVTGPGSFPISRTIPFALKEFSKIESFLTKRSDVVIYCSTLYTDDGAVNPLCTEVDGIILCCRIEEMEEGQLQRSLADLGSKVPPVDIICFCDREQAPAVPAGARGAEGVAEAADVERPGAEQAAAAPGGTGPAGEEERTAAYIERTDEIEEFEEARTGGLNIPRIVTIVVAVIIIGFISWWVIVDRSIRGKSEANRRTELVQKQREVRDRAAGEQAARGTTAPSPVDTAEATIATPGLVKPPGEQEPERSVAGEETRTVDRDERADTLPKQMGGETGAIYAIHVASFKDIARAGREKEYLEKRGYTVSIVAKEIKGEEWLRILVGEYATREEAMRARAELMDLPGVGYAQIIELKERR